MATASAGLIIVFTGFERADPIASLVVVFLMARAGIRLLRDSGWVLLEAAPLGLDPDVTGDTLVDFGIHHTTMQVDHAGPEHGASGITPYTAHCDDAHGPAHSSGPRDH